MSKRLTIVVGGYIVGYPLGGMTWHHLNYLLGLHELGHEVWFLEDSGSDCYPYNPATWTSGPDPTHGLEYLRATFQHYGLPLRYCYYSEFLNKTFCMSTAELNDLLKRADLLLCVSGVTPIRPNRPRPRCIAVIDTDPVYTQLRMRGDANFAAYYRQFAAVATFGRLIGTPACPLPTHGFRWIPTHQPICLRHWPQSPPGGNAFTTIGKWDHSAERHVEFDGRRYLSSKAGEWLKLLDLPARVKTEMVMAMQSMPGDIAEKFAGHGWKLPDAERATRDCRAYADFIRESAGEFTVAKEIYAGIKSGWFSDRSAAYLATGRPVVTQDTGFDQWLPTGSGLFSFNNIDGAATALNSIHADYPTHSAAARRLAEEWFDSRRVLSELLNTLM